MEIENLRELVQHIDDDKLGVDDSDAKENCTEAFNDLAPDKAVDAFLETTGKDPWKSNDQKLQQGLNLVQRLQDASVGIETTYAHYVIQMGRMLLWMKQEVRAMKKKWGPWAKVNLPFLGERVRQQYLQLAKRPDAYGYGYLGKERLLKAVRLTKDSEAQDPIGDLLSENGLRFDPQGGTSLIEFGARADDAITRARRGEDAERSEAQRKVASFSKQLRAVKRTGEWFMDHPEWLSHEVLSTIESAEELLGELKTAASSLNTQEEEIAV